MGLLGMEQFGDVRVAMWTPSETLSELEAILGNASLVSGIKAGISSEKRLRERLAAHVLLRHISGEDHFIDHDMAGRPFVPCLGMSLSISHCPECVAVAVSSDRVGVDVEKTGSRQLGVMDKFISAEEMSGLPDGNKELYVSLLWSAKEAVYKLVCGEGISFVRDIFVPGFVLQDSGEISASCRTKNGIKDIVLLYRFYNGFVSVIAVFKV